MDQRGEISRAVNGMGGEGLTRRAFLQRTAADGAALVAGLALPGALLRAATGQDGAKSSGDPGAGKVPRARVVVVTHPEAILPDDSANRGVLERMLETGLRELTGADSERKAWQQVAADGDRVSMKTTRAGGPNLRTHEAIPAYLSRRLAQVAGLAEDRIRAWDRPDLEGAELELSEPYTLPTTGKATRLRAALVREAGAIINLPVLKTHSGTGASIAMKNHFGSINNPSAFHGWERGEMARSIAELSAVAPIRKRTRLVVVDALRPLYFGGPFDNPKARWNFGGIILGTDPVAVERVALDVLETHREEVRGEPWPLVHARRAVEWGEHIGLGQANRNRIDVARIKLD